MDWTLVTDWLLQHGIRILIILLLVIIIWFALKIFLPPLADRSVARTREKESKAGMEKRTRTLVGVFMEASCILIGIIIIFMILSEVRISISPALAGLGIIGVAVGFGAQWLIRDLIAGSLYPSGKRVQSGGRGPGG